MSSQLADELQEDIKEAVEEAFRNFLEQASVDGTKIPMTIANIVAIEKAVCDTIKQKWVLAGILASVPKITITTDPINRTVRIHIAD